MAYRVFEAMSPEAKARTVLWIVGKAASMKWAKDILAKLQGKKTYLTIAAGAVCGGLQAAGVEIPPWVYAVLAGLGITFARMGAARDARAAAGDEDSRKAA